jgi:small conductance mechanosensitive channel
MKAFPAYFLTMILPFSIAVHAQDAQAPGEAVEVKTEAERVIQIQKIIESDQARLEELKKDLKEREDDFERTGNDLAKREVKLEAMEAQLEETADSAEKATLQTETDAYREKYEIVKSQTDLNFQTEKTVRDQVQTLEKKIGIDQQALDELLGTAEAPQVAEPPVGAPVPIPPAAQPAPAPGVVPGLMPGFPAAPATPGATPGVVPETLPETTEQIEARKEAEKTGLEAEQAEQALLTFLERKAALQEQIDFEKTLLDTVEMSKANVDQAVQIRRQELADAIAGGDKAELERAQKNLVSINEALRSVTDEIDERENTLEGFHERMQALQEEQLAVTQEAVRARAEAEDSREESVWLNSPFNPKNILRWALDRGPDMLAVILIALVLLVLIRRFVQNIARVMVGKGRRSRRDATTRADTLALSFGSAATMVIAMIAILLVFEAAGVNVATILGGAAILGVAIAFGAQNLMRDYFNGFIILIEDQYELNDLVTINNITGRVERVSLRTTALRDLQGKLHFIPNGEIKSVTNRSYEWAQIVLHIRVSYKENVDRVMDEILKVVRGLCAEPEFRDSIIDEPKMLGVDEFAEFGVIIKCILRTEPNDLFRIKRETLRRIKNRFDELGIEIPVPGVVTVSNP